MYVLCQISNAWIAKHAAFLATGTHFTHWSIWSNPLKCFRGCTYVQYIHSQRNNTGLWWLKFSSIYSYLAELLLVIVQYNNYVYFELDYGDNNNAKEAIRVYICSCSDLTQTQDPLLVSRYMHLLHWGSYNALWNVRLLTEGQSLLYYCVNNFKMAVCFGQSMDSLYSESAPPSELLRCVPHLSPFHQVQGVTQSLCWQSLLHWHLIALLEKVASYSSWRVDTVYPTPPLLCFMSEIYKSGGWFRGQ